ncbi:type IV pilus modification protein PilV [Thalassotalea agarivorans]|uniref:Type IV pilus assembly protein PilV n=1 Tax=Thalassotalea agarivorans TaxID=349064 RepID=A0A1H9YTQ5_THASX|nr:type IV pilus modification protein PilV [Thalassotalea agarivorans]SES72063.1 type IV pilus assembly protein PilV [Thalassotalea agarivorans]
MLTKAVSKNISSRTPSKIKGMTFLEVLVALFIIVTGILGAVALEGVAKRNSYDAMQRSVATSLAQDIIERMRNNETALNDYVGNFGSKGLTKPTICKLAVSCTAAQIKDQDLYEWEQALIGANASGAGGLLSATGCIEHTLNAVTITISWQGRTETSDGGTGDCGAANNTRRQLVVEGFVF